MAIVDACDRDPVLKRRKERLVEVSERHKLATTTFREAATGLESLIDKWRDQVQDMTEAHVKSVSEFTDKYFADISPATNDVREKRKSVVRQTSVTRRAAANYKRELKLKTGITATVLEDEAQMRRPRLRATKSRPLSRAVPSACIVVNTGKRRERRIVRPKGWRKIWDFDNLRVNI